MALGYFLVIKNTIIYGYFFMWMDDEQVAPPSCSKNRICQFFNGDYILNYYYVLYVNTESAFAKIIFTASNTPLFKYIELLPLFVLSM